MEDENSKTEGARCLTDLNDDCLIYICSLLNPIERFRLAIVSKTFDTAVEQFAHLYELRMDQLCQHFTFAEVKQILKRFGEQIRRVGPWRFPKNEYLLLISSYCHNIEEIEVSCYPYCDLKLFLEIFKASSGKIRKIILQCYMGLKVNLADMLLRSTPSLKSLELYRLRINGMQLMNLVDLKELRIEDCLVKSKYFIRLCKVLKLKKLNINGCRLLDSQSFQALYETQTDLEELIITDKGIYRYLKVLGRLQKLRKIEACFLSGDNLEGLLNELVEHHANDLESLHLDCRCCFKGEDAKIILRQMLKFQNLRTMTIPTLYMQSYDEELENFIQNWNHLEELRIGLVQEYNNWLPHEALLELVRLKSLKRLEIGPSFLLPVSVIPDFYEILKAKEVVPLHLFLKKTETDRDAGLFEFLDTAHYRENEKYLKIQIDPLDNYEDYL